MFSTDNFHKIIMLIIYGKNMGDESVAAPRSLIRLIE